MLVDQLCPTGFHEEPAQFPVRLGMNPAASTLIALIALSVSRLFLRLFFLFPARGLPSHGHTTCMVILLPLFFVE